MNQRANIPSNNLKAVLKNALDAAKTKEEIELV
jgi:hypothetical protein